MHKKGGTQWQIPSSGDGGGGIYETNLLSFGLLGLQCPLSLLSFTVWNHLQFGTLKYPGKVSASFWKLGTLQIESTLNINYLEINLISNLSLNLLELIGDIVKGYLQDKQN